MEATGEYCRFEHSGRVDLCFDSLFLTHLLQEASKYILAKNGWYTETTLVKLTGKSYNWVRRRLKKFQNIKKHMTDSTGALRYHYPPRVFDSMTKELNWDVNTAIRYYKKDTRRDDSAGRLLMAIKHGMNQKMSSLLKIGIPTKDIHFWKSAELITIWENGQCHFTKKAQLVAERIEKAEKHANNLLRDTQLYIE